MNELMQEPMFYYAIAFVIFLALAYILGRKPALAWIDSEIAKIAAELDSARQLRAEAETALADCKAKQARAENEARMIVDMAKHEVEEMRKKADADLAAYLARQQELAAERIRLAESEAVADVRAAAIAMSMDSARKNLSENLSEGDAVRLIDQAVADVPMLKAHAV
ncbi:MAG: hypothetical protein P4M13_01700 [Alphaproteobacteria bacterium]|nr:hypothetical protein [Alphaproteobacteria bacterium]